MSALLRSHEDGRDAPSRIPTKSGRAGFGITSGMTAFWLIALVPVVVVLTTPHVVVQDGGLHLANAVAVRGLIDSWFPSFLTARPILVPNITVEAVLAGLTTVLDADNSLRAVIVIGLLGYALAVAALVRSAGLPVYMGIPLLAFQMNFFVMLGFLGFVWAVPLALGAIALVVRRPLDPPQVPLVLLLVATWLTHMVPAVIATVTATLIVVVAHLANGERPLKAIVPVLKVTALPVAVMATLTLVWAAQTGSSQLALAPHVLHATKSLLEFSAPLVAYAHAEIWLSRILSVSVYVVAAAVVITRIRQRRFLDRLDGLLAASGAMAVLTVVLPEQASSGASYVSIRISLFAILLLILWVCTQLRVLNGRVAMAGWAMVAVAAVVAVAIPLVRIPALNRLSSEAEQIAALAPCVPQHSTIIQLNLDLARRVSVGRMAPMAEQTGTITVPRQSLDLGNESGWYPYYLWRFTDVARVDRHVRAGGHFDDAPPPIDLNSAMAHGLPLDGVVIYGRAAATASVLADPTNVVLERTLTERFHLVRTSDQGNAELWLRKGVVASC